MVDAVLPEVRARRAGNRMWRIGAGLGAAVALIGGGWLWAEWGPLIAFDSLISFCF